MKPVITRFAPSPTGFLHIGGARTALFNALYAQSQKGKMLLRIEDTDRKRSTQEAIEAIIKGLNWLGIHYDSKIIYQNARAEHHKEIAYQLLEKGHAYKCYATEEELLHMRETAQKEGRSTAYTNLWRNKDEQKAPLNVPYTIRLKTPLKGKLTLQDKVQGSVAFPLSDIEDFILLRSDGTPTYMLAVIVDDYDMGVTHVIRGDDHLINTAKQILLYQALGWELPTFAHISLIHGADGAKLSKRHGALGIEAYRDMGFLAKAMVNYLALLGWSNGDNEIFSQEEAAQNFSLEALGKSPSRFDIKKLSHINAHYMRHLPEQDVLKAFYSALPTMVDEKTHNLFQENEIKQLFEKAFPALKERSKTLLELIDNASFILEKENLTFDEKTKNIFNDEIKQLLQELKQLLLNHSQWQHYPLYEALQNYAENKGLKFGKIAQPLRGALTGRKSSPGVLDVMLILGKERTLKRIDNILS